MLLLASESSLQVEVRAALQAQLRADDPSIFFELVYLDITLIADFLSILDLLDYVRQGIFDVIHIVPPAATWSRSRHSDIPGPRPLRSRLAPLGLPSLTPSENDKVNSANRALEAVLWCAEQALCCKTKAVGLNIIFPEDLGGQQSEGPSSLWVLREIQLLEGIRDARRAAGYLCQFTRTDFKRPLGVFSTSRKLRARLSLGWPRLERIHDKLVYKGPLPKNFACNHIHTPMIGTSSDDVFCSSSSHTFYTTAECIPRVDAQASSTRTGIGGWYPARNSKGELDPWCSDWFSLEISKEDFPWIFEKGDKPSLVISTLEALAILISLKLRFGDAPDYDDTKVLIVPSITDNRGNGAVLNKLMTTRFPSSVLLMEMGSYMKARGMRAIVEWAPREFNKEADQLANGITDSFDPNRRLHVSSQTLTWNILPMALQAGRDAEQAFRDMKERYGLPDRCKKQRKRKVETRLKITDPW